MEGNGRQIIDSFPDRFFAKSGIIVLISILIVTYGAVGVTGEELLGTPVATGDVHESDEHGFEESSGTTRLVLRLETDSIDPLRGDGRMRKERVRDLQEPTVHELERMGGIDIVHQFWLINAIAVEVDTDRVSVDRLSNVVNVDSMHADFTVTPMEAATQSTASLSRSRLSGEAINLATSDVTYGVAQINADDAWSEYGTKGSGVKVAVLDTGLEVDHPDLELYTRDSNDPTYPGGWAEFDSNGNQIDGSEPYDAGDHGTHVSGTVAGGDSSGQYIGVAPGASLMHAKVMDSAGYYSQIVAGMEWAIDNDADVISMSLGSSGYDGAWIDPIRNAQSHGVVVVTSIGNTGEGTSSTPGNDYDSIGVGATDESLEVGYFSSGEPVEKSDWNNPPSDWPSEYIVPSVAAPGVGIESADPDGGYQLKDGTSMAAPHVAGAVALMQSATSTHHSPDEIKEALQQTAWKPDSWDESDAANSIDGQDTRYGYGIIDVPAAIEYLKNGGEPEPSFSVASASLDTSTILEGESVDVSADVENSGDADGTFTAELQEDGTTVATTDVTVAAGTTETVTFTRTYETAGSYDLAVSATTAGTLTVEQPATFDITGTSLSSSTIIEGESVDVSADVENSGDADGTFTAKLQEDGTTVATTDVTVAAGSTETVTFTRTYDTAGSYDLAVNDTAVETLTVEEATAEFTVSGASLQDDTILAGDTAESTATVENTGDADGEFTAELHLTDANGETTTRDTETVTLAAGESTTVTLTDAVDVAGTYDADVSGDPAGTLTVDQPATFGITTTALSESTIMEGESVTIEATVENTGDRGGTFTAGLREDGTVIDTKDVAVAAGSTETVTFTDTYNTAGSYDLAVNDTAAGTLTVEEATAEFTVSNAGLADSTILAGETAKLTATVENTGDAEGTYTAEFRADGTTRTSTDVTLAAGESTTVSLTAAFDTAGSYNVALSNTDAGTLTVEQPATFGITATSLSSSTITEGESVTVSADVENTGDRDGTFTAELQEDGTTVATTDVTVAAGSTETVTFTRTYDTAGSYDLAVSATTAGTLTVEEATAAFTVSGASLSDSTILEGDTAEVTATVENTGDASGEFTAEFQLTDTNGQTTTRDTMTVTLGAGESTTVTLADTVGTTSTYDADVSGDPAGTLTVEQPATFEITSTTLGAGTITEGESVTVSADVENTGDRDGQFTAGLLVDGSVAGTTTVTVSAGTSKTVSFDETFTTPGDYAIDVNNTAVGTLTVEEATAAFAVSGASLTDTTILEGDTAEVTATVENTGDRSGTFTAELLVDGTQQSTADVEVPGGGTTTVTFTELFEDPGEYTIDVNEARAGTLTVEETVAEFTVSGATLADDTILEGETAEATATVENVGDDEGQFTAEFRLTDASGRTTTRDTTTVTLGADESTTVTLADTVGTAGEYDATVGGESTGTLTVEQPATFGITDTALSASTITEGETVTVEATVENTGDRDGTFTAELRVDGTVEGTTDVEVPGGETATVTFEPTFPEAGEHTVGVNDARAGTVTVESVDPAQFEVSNTALDDATILAGDTAQVSATVENVGDEAGTYTATFRADGDTVDSQDLALDSGESERVTLTATFDDAGTCDVTVSGADVGTLTVERPATFAVVSADLDTHTITAEETATVTATVENVGDRDGTHEVTLLENGEAVTTTTVLVPATETRTVTFERTYDEPGSYDFAVDGTAAGTLTVTEADPAAFLVEDVSGGTGSTSAGEPVEITATVTNTGEQRGTAPVRLLIDGVERDAAELTLDADENRTVRLRWEPGADDAGEYTAIVESPTDSETTPVTVRGSPSFAVDAPEANAPVTAGEQLQVEATVENTGWNGTQRVRLLVNGTKRDATELALDGGESRTVTLSWDTDEGDAGTHDLVVASGTANATVTARVTPANGERPPPVVGGEPPQDLTGDGVYEDIDGNGEFTVGDVQQFFQHRDSEAVRDNAEFFDLTGDGQVSVGDVQRLFMELMAES
jgi:subtilisin family serine protease